MNLDAISRAANENTDPDPSERDFAELMANALRVCLDDLLANRGPMTDEQRKAMFARIGGGRGATRSWDAPTGDRFGSEIYAKKPWWKSAKDWGGKEAEEYASKGFGGKAIDFMDELASTGMMGTAMGGTGQFTADTIRSAKSQAGILARGNYISRLVPLDAADVIEPLARGNAGARVALLNKWADLSNQGLPSWEIVKKITQSIGNRSPTTLLETAIRVARTPDAVLANARRPLTDEQKRAIFAKSRGGGGRIVRTLIGKDPNTDFRYGGSGDLNRDSRNRQKNWSPGPPLNSTPVPIGLPGNAGLPGQPPITHPGTISAQPTPFAKSLELAGNIIGKINDGSVGPKNARAPWLDELGNYNPNWGPWFDGRTKQAIVDAWINAGGQPPDLGPIVGIGPVQPVPNPIVAPLPQIAPQPAQPAFQLPAIPGPVAPVPEWQPQPQPSGGSGLIGTQPNLPPVNHVAPPSGPITPPQPQPPTTPEPQPEPEPQPAPEAPPSGGSNEGTPSWSVPGYGDPALPSRLGRPVVPGTDQPPKPVKPAPKPPKMPKITPAMLERLRKRIAGE